MCVCARARARVCVFISFLKWSNVNIKRLYNNRNIFHVSQGILMLNIKALALTVLIVIIEVKVSDRFTE